MKKLLIFLFSLASVMVIALTVKIMTPYFVKNSNQMGLTEVGPKINVLVIDKPKQSTEALIQHINQGDASLLLWIENKEGVNQAYTFNTLESLVRLERNKLGFLDVNDADLKHLYVARYDKKNKILYYKSVREAKISIIEANRNYLIGEILSDPNNNNVTAGTVVYTDGKENALRMVKILESQIEEASLQPENQKVDVDVKTN